MLAVQYLQRYREKGDLGDLIRAQAQAQHSLREQPYNNAAAISILTTVDQDFHRFHAAATLIDPIYRAQPTNQAVASQRATIALELGDYDAARHMLAKLKPGPFVDASRETTLSRYEELTGHIDEAKRLLRAVTVQQDTIYDAPAEARAWYHFRMGELEFASGDPQGAIKEEQAALTTFPQYARAYDVLARVYCARHDWRDALSAATASSDLLPAPEALGCKEDAQRALGDAKGAAQSAALIDVLDRIGNSYRVNDRLLSIYYTDHDRNLDEAYAIARRELLLRDDVLTEDTLAWAAAKTGRWSEARHAAARATRYSTQDARLLFHAGMIALHFGDRAAARRYLGKALALNPLFHETYADLARRTLASL
jgi:tetratricopeptide (TPR) repeat protein